MEASIKERVDFLYKFALECYQNRNVSDGYEIKKNMKFIQKELDDLVLIESLHHKEHQLLKSAHDDWYKWIDLHKRINSDNNNTYKYYPLWYIIRPLKRLLTGKLEHGVKKLLPNPDELMPTNKEQKIRVKLK